MSFIYLNKRCSGALWHLSGGTLDGTWTTLLRTIRLLSEFHLGISQTESATANRHILSFIIQDVQTQSLPKCVRVIRGSCSFELAVPNMCTKDGVWPVGESTRFWIIVMLVKERCLLESVELPVSLQFMDLSLKRLIKLGPFYKYRENSGEDIDTWL